MTTQYVINNGSIITTAPNKNPLEQYVDLLAKPTIKKQESPSLETYNIDRYLKKRSAPHVDYEQEQNYIALPGTSSKVILEFPNYNMTGKSAVIELDDVITVAFSSHRVKAPVTNLGQVTHDGYGLGTRLVAGSIIRSVFTVDNLTALQSKIYLEDAENIKNRLLGIDGQVPSGLPNKDRLSIVQDDLTAFNIHIYSIAETIGYSGVPRERFDTIIGATIVNTGQVYSVEDLISESTVSFQAKAHRASTNITDYSRGYSNNEAFKTATQVLQESLGVK